MTWGGSSINWTLARTAFVAVWLGLLFNGVGARGQESFKAMSTAVVSHKVPAESPSTCRIIYLGFVGALEPPNNKHSGIVQIRELLQEKQFSDVCARSFSPYVWTEGESWLLAHFPAHAGPLSPEELQCAPKVILVGHSMGGWAMLSVARDLRNRAIPVELTIQVDSVGITDYTIPRNVKSAAIFHANDMLMLLTTKHLRLEDPNFTKLVANVKVNGAGHESVTRDPRIRELVLNEVKSLRMTSAAKSADVATVPTTGSGHGDRQR